MKNTRDKKPETKIVPIRFTDAEQHIIQTLGKVLGSESVSETIRMCIMYTLKAKSKAKK